MNIKTTLHNVGRVFAYNTKIIFGNRFFYALLISVGVFIAFSLIYIFDSSNVRLEDIYSLLRIPALLLLIYPTLMGIQNDADSRTLEIIFGIPDYRFKVWLVRLVMIFIITFLLLIPLAALLHWAIISFRILPMVFQLMPLMLFAGTLGFALSSIVKNGMGAAVLYIILGVVLMIVFENNSDTFWNIFLNPYDDTSTLNAIVREEMLMKNRIFLLSASVIFVLVGLFQLQRREKFLG